MKSVKQILLPLDFENVATSMVQLAFSMAKSVEATVTVFNVVNDKKLSEVNFAPISDMIEEMTSKGELQKANYQFVIKKGVPEAEILKYSEQNDVYVIIMDTRMKQEKQQEMIGSITAEVIDASKVPVLVIPKGLEIKDFKEFTNVGLATSMHQFDDLTFQNFMDFMENIPNFKFDLTMVHVQEKGENAQNYEQTMRDTDKYLSEFHKEIKSSYAIIPMEKSVSTDIVNFFKDSDFKLLVLKNKLRSVFSRLFQVSVPKKLVYHAQTPMLIFPKDERPLAKLKTLH